MIFPEFDPVAFWVGPVPVRWYALAYIAGFVLGWRYCLYWARKIGGRPNAEDIDDFVPWAVIGVILGGRLGYILFYQWDFYAANPFAMLRLWEGGMAFHGGLVGVVVTTILYARTRGIELLRFGDLLAACAPIGLFFGRLANFVNGELFGRVSDAPWAMVFPHGGPFARHPSQLYEAVLEGLLLFVVLFAALRCEKLRARPGSIAGLFFIGYGAARFTVEFFREPDTQLGLFFGDLISMGQILSLPMIMFGVGLIVYALKRHPGKRESR